MVWRGGGFLAVMNSGYLRIAKRWSSGPGEHFTEVDFHIAWTLQKAPVVQSSCWKSERMRLAAEKYFRQVRKRFFFFQLSVSTAGRFDRRFRQNKY
jgi:hypothetical protein